MNGSHQELAYAYVIGDDIRTIKRNTDVLLNACKYIGLAVVIGKTKCMEVGCHLGMMTNEHIMVCILHKYGTMLDHLKAVGASMIFVTNCIMSGLYGIPK